MGRETRTMTNINAQAETWRDVTRSLRAHADTTPGNINTRKYSSEAEQRNIPTCLLSPFTAMPAFSV